MSDTLRLRVIGVAGGGWEIIVKRELLDIDGVEGVTTSYQANLIGIAFDAGRVTSDALQAKVEALGYTVDRV